MDATGKPHPYREVLRLVWPLALGMANNALMQFADRAFLARDSMLALEAVLPATTLAWIFMSFFQSLVGYSGVFVAQYHGAGDAASCARSFRAGMVLAAVSGLLTLPLLPLGNWIFACTASSPELLALERSYYDIILLSGFLVFGQMAATSYFTGRGRPRVVFWVNVLGNLLNVALDPLLIFGLCGFPHLGIAGAAYATVLALALQFAVLVFLVCRDMRRERADAPVKAKEPLAPLMWRILRYGIPAGGYEVLNMASFTIFVFVTGQVGDVAFAASNACFSVNYLLFAPMAGFGIGAQTLVGQALGRRDEEEARLALRRTLILGVGFVTVLSAAAVVFHGPILAMFAPDAGAGGQALAARREFLSTGSVLMALMATWQVFDATDVIISGALKGAGDTHFVMGWMLVCAFAFWLPLVFLVFRFHPTMPALWATMIAFVVVICAGTWIRWRRGPWRSIKLV